MIHSKSNIIASASRTRASAKTGRRVLKAKPSMPLGRPLANGLLDDPPVAQGGKIIAGAPAGRIGLDAEIVEPGLERLEHGGRVAIIIDADLVEIIEAAVDRQVARPIIGIALERQPFARLHFRDDIGPRADRDLQGLFVEMFGVGMGARQDRHQRQRHRQFAVVGAGQVAAHRQGVGGLDAFDEAEGGALLRPALFLQQVEGEGDVVPR